MACLARNRALRPYPSDGRQYCGEVFWLVLDVAMLHTWRTAERKG